MISYTRELDKICKAGVAQYLTRPHDSSARRVHHKSIIINSDFFCAGIYVDNPGCEAILQTSCKGWYGICFVQNDVR